MSGAGRRLTCRSVAAWLARWVTDARIPAVGGGAGRGNDLPVPGAVERPGVGGEFGVDGGPVLRGQARRFLHEQGGAPFVELPGLQGGEGVGHFGDEGFGQAQEPAALGGGFPPGQGDLRADPGAQLRRGHPGVGLVAALEQVEGDGQTRLAGGQGRLSVFQGPDFSNQTRTVLRCVPGRPDSSQRPGHVHDHYLFWLSLVGPLIAVHENTLSGTCDKFRRRGMRENGPMSDAGDFMDLALQRESSWSRAEEAEARHGGGHRYYGASVGAVRGTVRDTLRRHPGMTHDDITALSSELWEVPVFERRLAGVVLLQSCVRLLTNTDLTRIEGFVRSARLGALVDPLAIDVVGPLIEGLDVVGRVRADSVLDRWVRDPDDWLRRAALLSPLRALRAGAGDWPRFVRHSRLVLESPPRRIPEDDGGAVAAAAVSLVLAETAKHRPELDF